MKVAPERRLTEEVMRENAAFQYREKVKYRTEARAIRRGAQVASVILLALAAATVWGWLF